MGFLHHLATSERTGFRWGIVGTIVPTESFAESIWNGIWCQFIVANRVTNEPLGIVMGYRPNFNDGHASVAQVMVDEAQGSGLGIEGLGLFVNLLFQSFNLRKLYFEVLEYNISRFRDTVGTWLKEEGRLKDHSYFAGRWWDQSILALYRDDFNQKAQPLLQAIQRQSPREDI